MAKFITGNELNLQVEKLFESAEKYLLLISPHIKLDDRFASLLKAKMDDHNFQITLVLGMNQDDLIKSMSEEDFRFYMEFPNIEIRHEKRLHTKYFANEKSAIFTTMNLYGFSQDNNIEAGIVCERKGVLDNLIPGASIEHDAHVYFTRITDESEILFRKEPVFENKMLGLSKKYKQSEVVIDKLTAFFTSEP